MMLKLQVNSMKQHSDAFEKAGVSLPRYDINGMREKTKREPIWVHFGAGNIFRSFIAALVQDSLNEGLTDKGIIAAESFDFGIVDAIYKPHDNLSLLVKMHANGVFEKELIGSVAESVTTNYANQKDWTRLQQVFCEASLQLASFTITEKGYALRDMAGEYFPMVLQDIENGPAAPRHTMSIVTTLAYARFKMGELPLAFVSMDNCSQNGKRLQDAVLTIAREWCERGFVEERFLSYLTNPRKISFPWTMIDKITPHPAESVQMTLNRLGFMDMDIVVTGAKTFIAPFVNAEANGYLIVEDNFPAGHMPIATPNVHFTDRSTVEKTEKMKVCTCLNPIHTALALYGCLLGYAFIWEAILDQDLQKLLERLVFTEGMPVVADPGIISPLAFAREVMEERFPNPNIPDTPQRIATDTSQKIGIRFGETLKLYQAKESRPEGGFVCIPLVIATWFRYLLGVDDKGDAIALSPDPMMQELRDSVSSIFFGKPESYRGQLQPVLKNEALFHVDLEEIGLSERIEKMFVEMLVGPGSVRSTLQKYIV